MECSKCSYPNIAVAETCANCGNDLTKAIVVSKNDYVKVIPSSSSVSADSLMLDEETFIQNDLNKTISQKEIHNNVESDINKTVSQKASSQENGLDLGKTITDEEYNLIITGKHHHEDFLVNRKSSSLVPTYLNSDVPQYNPIEFNEEIIIVRGNTDPGDVSISSKPHARIAKKNGKWFLENLASNKAVFVQVNEDVEIKKGSVILLGSEKFYEFIPKIDEEE